MRGRGGSSFKPTYQQKRPVPSNPKRKYTDTPQYKVTDKSSFQGINVCQKKPPHLLTDQQMRHFLLNGYVVVKTKLPHSFHQYIYQQATQIIGSEGNPGNNILPRLPSLQRVFDDPSVKGALVSLLGPDYELHPHRHLHDSTPGFKSQKWHRDSYWGYRRPLRYNTIRYVMAMYYPQDVTLKNGPTGAKPGTQYYCIDPKYYQGNLTNHFSKDDPITDKPLCVSQGEVVFIHYDIIHKGSANETDNTRFMFKFQFIRMREPEAPSWDWKGIPWEGKPQDNREKLLWPVCQHIWLWLCGKANTPTEVDMDGETVESLISKLSSTDEPVRFYAAYKLGLLGQNEPLLGHLRHEETQFRLAASYGLSASTDPSTLIPNLINCLSSPPICSNVLFVLCELGTKAVNTLKPISTFVKNRDKDIRLYAIEALGHIGPVAKEVPKYVIDALIIGLSDNDDQARFTAALSLGRLKEKANDAVPQLLSALDDYNRYVQAYALISLKRINTMEAQQGVMDYLWASRWCPLSGPHSTY